MPPILHKPVSKKKTKRLDWKECPKLVELQLNSSQISITDQAFFSKGSSPTLIGSPITVAAKSVAPSEIEAINIPRPTIVVSRRSSRVTGSTVDRPSDVPGRDSFHTAATTLAAIESSRDVISSQQSPNEQSGTVSMTSNESSSENLLVNVVGSVEGQVAGQVPLDITEEDLKRSKATVYTILEPILGKVGCQHDFLRELFRTSSPSILSVESQQRFIVDVAQALSHGRTHTVSLVTVALTLYVLTSAASFSVVLGGNPTTVPSGRIAVAMNFHYLVSAVLITCLIGSFPSRAYCIEQFKRVAHAYGLDFGQARKNFTFEDD
ncbi:hypothetical protein K469DRAFT_761694 [Zopfia rhizophila CBS 207.26]|uniref:Uncharacterized protein n=1 Tax=Zopfia rhizophila CBS 207.26 TaxID=1314779 RepID=A0A6A6DC94_9PEZI|nr:hypothetical protein K469DRAFT_761694 [Zopfia rhizophila CBS 207.26]